MLRSLILIWLAIPVALAQEVTVEISADKERYTEGTPVFLKVVVRNETPHTVSLLQPPTGRIERQSVHIYLAADDGPYEELVRVEKGGGRGRQPLKPASSIGGIHEFWWYTFHYRDKGDAESRFSRCVLKAPATYRIKVEMAVLVGADEDAAWFESNEVRVKIAAPPATERAAHKAFFIEMFSRSPGRRIATAAALAAFIAKHPDSAYAPYAKWKYLQQVEPSDVFQGHSEGDRKQILSWIEDVFGYSKGMQNHLREDTLYWMAQALLVDTDSERPSVEELQLIKRYYTALTTEFPWSRHTPQVVRELAELDRAIEARSRSDGPERG